MSSYDPLDLQSQQRAAADSDLRARIDLETEEADFKWLMGSKRGRRIVWRQLDRQRVFRLSFNTNAMTMAFNEGMRNEGLRILDQIHSLCPEQYHAMVKEHLDGRRNTDDGSDSGPSKRPGT